MRSRAMRGMSTYTSVVISPATTTRPVVISVSHATRAVGSFFRTASRTESEIWSAILSGWPSVTDSEVNENERVAMGVRLAVPAEEANRESGIPPGRRAPEGGLPALIGEERHLGREARVAERLLGGELRPARAQRLDPARLRGEHELAADRCAMEDRRLAGEELVEGLVGRSD